MLRRDEHVVLVEAAVAPMVDSGHNTVGSVVTFRNVTAARRLTNELTYHANHDALTGLDNRRAFEFRLERAVGSASEQGCRHCLLYFDLDYFKAVNDQAGHVAGDELLRQLAAVLRKQLREHDMLARLGGDEFGVLLSNCTHERATRASRKCVLRLLPSCSPGKARRSASAPASGAWTSATARCPCRTY